jgi:hypothetical protein
MDIVHQKPLHVLQQLLVLGCVGDGVPGWHHFKTAIDEEWGTKEKLGGQKDMQLASILN